jgi:hypothetical protein
MRTISESKFARLKGRKGVTVKRKLGKQKLKKIESKTSKSAVPDNMPLSGDRSSELSASASRVKILELMIGNNTKMIESLRKGLDLVSQILSRPKESWTHVVKRKGNLISSVTSRSGSKLVVHKIYRDKDGVINSISTRNE